VEREERRLDREGGDEAEEDPVARALADLHEVESVLRQPVDDDRLTVIAMAAAIVYGFWVGRGPLARIPGADALLTGAVVGVFTARTCFSFYAFFEGDDDPLYVLVRCLGRARTTGRHLKFVLFTMAGSLLMLDRSSSTGCRKHFRPSCRSASSTSDWVSSASSRLRDQGAALPLHGLLRDAYRESSPEVAAILSGVVSKAAAYGFPRIAITKFPEPAQHYRAPILALAAIGLIYGSLLAFRAPDIRGVIAYSSLAQMGLITMGIFSINDLGLGRLGVLQMVITGLVSTDLFLSRNGPSGNPHG